MTIADFVAACFWPLAVLFAVLLNTVRDPVLSRSIGLVAVICGLSYLMLWVTYGRSSMLAIIDWYLFLLVLGFELVWWGLRQWHLFRSIPKSKLKACAAVIGGIALAVSVGTILVQDFLLRPVVLEGRVHNVRGTGRRHAEYLANIAGRTVKVTAPVYERLKFLPVVRVEVGRGSDYVYRVEYLAN
jgi:hypothetical protein